MGKWPDRVAVRTANTCRYVILAKASLFKAGAILAALLYSLVLARNITVGKPVASLQFGRDRLPPRERKLPPRIRVSQKGDANRKGMAAGARKPMPNNELLRQIKRDTGRSIALSNLLSVLYYATQRADRQRIMMIRSRAETSCGDNAHIFVYDKFQGKYLELLGLRCVENLKLAPRMQFTSRHPDLFYVTGDKNRRGRYTAVLKFNGHLYTEHSCGTSSQKDDGKQITIRCDGRGLIKS